MTTDKTVIYALPYAYDASFFSFSSYEEYELKYKAQLPVEEYELDFNDGSEFSQILFEAISKREGHNLEKFFDLLKEYDDKITDKEVVAFMHLIETTNDSCEDMLNNLDDVIVYEGKPVDVAYDLVDDIYADVFKKNPALQSYFDYEMFARDMGYNGEISTYELNNTDYCVTE